MALSDWDRQNLTREQQQAIETYTAQWQRAHDAGDVEGMRMAHEGAEAIRARAGYSGGAGGGEYLSVPQTTTKTTRTTTNGQTSYQTTQTENKGYDNGSLSTDDVKTLQGALGVAQDGYFGPQTKAAAYSAWGTSTADGAMNAYQQARQQQAITRAVTDWADATPLNDRQNLPKPVQVTATQPAQQVTYQQTDRGVLGGRNPAAVQQREQRKSEAVKRYEAAKEALSQYENDRVRSNPAEMYGLSDAERAARYEQSVQRKEYEDARHALEMAGVDPDNPNNDPSLGERIAKTLSGAGKTYAGTMVDAQRTAYEATQGARDVLYADQAADVKYSLDRAKAALAQMQQPGYEHPEDITSQQNVVNELQRLYDALTSARNAQAGAAKETVKLADQISESGALDIERAKQGASKAGQLLIDAGVGTAQMAADVGLGLATGGGSMLPMVIRSFGGGAQEARQQGYSIQKQTALGLASAATEYFTEKLFGGNPAYDTDVGLVNKLVDKLTKNKAWNGALMEVLSSVPAERLNEGLEEIMSDIFQPLAKLAITGDWDGYKADQIISDGVVGVLTALVAGAGEKAVKTVAAKDNGPLYLPTAEEAAAKITAPARGAGEARTEAVLEGNFIPAENRGAEARIVPERTQQPSVVATSQNPTISETLNPKTAESGSIPETVTRAMDELGTHPSAPVTGLEVNSLEAYGTTNAERQAEFRRAIELAKRFGVEVDVAELENGDRGKYENGKITLSPNVENPVMSVLVHELTHHMENSGRYEAFSKMILDYISDEMNVDIDTMKRAIRKEYAEGKHILDDAGAAKEIVAKFAESKLFTDEAAINRLARENRNLFEIIRDWLSDMAVKLTGTSEEKFIRNAERMYQKALENVGEVADTSAAQNVVEALSENVPKVEQTTEQAIDTVTQTPPEITSEPKYLPTAEEAANKLTNQTVNRPAKIQIKADPEIEAENISKGQAAIDQLFREAETAENPEELAIKGAMYRSDLGPIDFKWGRPGMGKNFKHGFGLAHLFAKRNAETGNGREAANKMAEVIAKATDVDIQHSTDKQNKSYRARLHYDGNTAVLAKEPNSNHWLLTGWEDNNETAAYATGEVHDSSGATAATPTRTRRDGGNAAVSYNSTITQPSDSVNPLVAVKWENADLVHDNDAAELARMDILRNILKDIRSGADLNRRAEASKAARNELRSVADPRQRMALERLNEIETTYNEYAAKNPAEAALSIEALFRSDYGMTLDEALDDAAWEKRTAGKLPQNVNREMQEPRYLPTAEEAANGQASYGRSFNEYAQEARYLAAPDLDDGEYSLGGSFDDLFGEPRYQPKAEEIAGKGMTLEDGTRVSPEIAAAIRQMQARRAEPQPRTVPDSLGRTTSKVDFEGTPALQALGVKIANSIGVYDNLEQLRGRDAAAKQVRKERRRAESRLDATKAEKTFAQGIASGLYTVSEIPASMDAEKVRELSDYYRAEQETSEDYIKDRRRVINRELEQTMSHLFRDSERFKPISGFVMSYRTPQRIMNSIFGETRAKAINEAIFDPVAENEAERIRFMNRMFDEVRTFEGRDGKASELTPEESSLVQQLIEGKAFEKQVAGMEMRSAIESAAENIRKGGDAADEAREFHLNASERKLAENYARWLQATDALDSGNVDTMKIQNAADKYSEMFDRFYAAINDFLVAHGYEPIGFIKGYAPHLQSEETQGLMNKAFKAMGINTDVSNLPTSIAGQTGYYKPNKRWNPYFMQRTSDQTTYDIVSAYESYVDYMSDVLYHTDDIMRIRQAANYFRKTYAPDEIKNTLDWANELKYGSAEQKAEFLRDQGVIAPDSSLSYEDVTQRMDEYVDELFGNIEKTTKYSDLVMWLDNYANLLAGKQNLADRGSELKGRTLLNVGNKLQRAFARTQVAANVSSMLNQTAQLPQIRAELGLKYTAKAIRDIASGDTRKGAWAESSDFLTEKRGINYLQETTGEKILSKMFWGAGFVDEMMSTIAVRGKYLQEIDAGKSPEAAMNAADQFGKSVMASRAKGSIPTAFTEKNIISRLINVFQVEAINSWEHISQDLPREFRETAKNEGTLKAALELAGVITKTLLSTFALNRIAEAIYGGTPAPFDVLGLAANFMASGEGLPTNDYLLQLINKGWTALFGEALFDDDDDDDEDKPFNWENAIEDTAYNISNDVPFVRNVSGVLGLGDNTLPLPNIYGGVKDIGSAVKNHGVASGETAKAVGSLAAELLPGGKQLKKTGLGLEALLRGGDYSGYGDDERLKYPIEPTAENIAKALLFGKYATSASDRYYAADGTALSANQTQLWKELKRSGADSSDIYETIQSYRQIDNNDSLTSLERGIQQRELLRQSPFTDRQKLDLYEGLNPDATSRAQKFEDMMSAGLDFGTIMDVYDVYAALEDREDLSAAQKATEFARWLDASGLSDDQRQLVKDRLRFYTHMPAEASRYDKLTGAGIGSEGAYDLTGTLSQLTPEDGKTSVSNMQQFRAISASDLSDKDKIAAIGTIMGTEMTTESGDPSQYAKMTDILRSGATLDQYLDIKESGGVDTYLKLAKAGTNSKNAYELALKISALEPEKGKDSVSSMQKYQIITHSDISQKEQLHALSAVMSDSEYSKVSTGADFGVEPRVYVDFKSELPEYDTDKNGSYTQAEVKRAIDSITESLDYIRLGGRGPLTTEEKAILWQLANTSWKPNKNPYSVSVGTKIYDAMHN